jgi:hypothetical protein
MIYNNFEISKVDHLDYEMYINIFKNCFNIDVNSTYFDWKYFSNPIGKMIGFEAKSGNQLAAFYGVMPEEYWIDNQKKMVFQSMDTMTNPDFRNNGLFVKLAEITYEKVQADKKELLLIGVPGSNSLYGFTKKLGWTQVKNINYTFCNRFLNYTFNFSSAKNYKFKLLESYDSKYDLFQENTKRKWMVQKVFSSDLLNWKIIKHPFQKFLNFEIEENNKTVGYIILKEVDANNHLIYYYDFLNDEYCLNALPSFASYFFKHYSTKNLFTWEPNSLNDRKSFKAAGFKVNPFKKGPFSYRIPLIIKSTDSKFSDSIKTDNFFLQPIIQD